MKRTGKSFRPAFPRAVNDKLTAAGLRRALNPPHDDTQDILHGVTVKDPFRPLEKLDAAETTAWEARENQKYKDFVRSTEAVEAEVIAFLNNARPKGMREGM